MANAKTVLATTNISQAVQQLTDPVQDLIAQLKLSENVFPVTTNVLKYGETKYLSWDFTAAPFKTLELLQITDVQFGHICCKVDRVIEYRDWILAKPNRFMIWTGDNIDSANMTSKGTPWENTGAPQQQIYEFVKIWAPARHRILGYVGGNHERRALGTFGDLGITIAALLRIPYSKGKQLIDVHFGQHRPFQISQWHGVGGARTFGTVAQVLMRFASEGDSQLYLMGHLHKPMIIPFWKERRGRGEIKAIKTIAALGSSFLDNWGSYGEVSGYANGDVLMPRCILEKDGGWEVTLR
jgi:hypothetical protein